ncbi:MAG: hypothetical protein LBT09_08345 [Planctomycetaceae bacterium]|nr:hypothetical protein [Planctomycetaceae bacterium]
MGTSKNIFHDTNLIYKSFVPKIEGQNGQNGKRTLRTSAANTFRNISWNSCNDNSITFYFSSVP